MDCPPKNVTVSGVSTVLHFFLLVLWRKLQEFYPIFFYVQETENPRHFTLASFKIQLTVISD